MIRTVALIALVGSASAAAADYKTAEIGCTNAYNAVTCDSYYTEADCNANDACLFVSQGDDEYCGLSADNAVTWDVDTLASENALGASRITCSALENTATACIGTCAPGMSGQGCTPSYSKVVSDLTTDGANGGIKGYESAMAFSHTTCGIHETDAACTAVIGCEFLSLTIGTETVTGCKALDSVIFEYIKVTCGDNGATAYATAAAAATPSGANAAAPAMVISALVGALAIFA